MRSGVQYPEKYLPDAIIAVAVLICGVTPGFRLRAEPSSPAYGLESRLPPKAYLSMPAQPDGVFPRLLSRTGAFKDTHNLVAGDGLVPYEVIVPFWSDGATKMRWMALPDGKIKFAPTGEWGFPKGTVFVKHFELATDETHPERKRRLETRLLVCDAAGGVYGATYKWRADNSDADLLATNLTEPITVRTGSGVRTQLWYYPSGQDCLTCHTANAGYVLGVKTRQLNRLSPSRLASPTMNCAPGITPGCSNQNLPNRTWRPFPDWRGPTTRRAALKTGHGPISMQIARNATGRAARSLISTRATTRRRPDRI
jgi:hypothetical protein